ncbi:MAG: NAD-dependent epimerase/dehydratase family protein, partial [Lysobacterales bacterium]
GFIGAHLVTAMELEGADVFALVRKQSDLTRLMKHNTSASRINVDLLDHERVTRKLKAIRPHYVFHTAVSRDYENWTATLEVNGIATLNLLRACLSESLQKFVHCGSSLEYGSIKTPFRESDAIYPESLFGASKAAASLQLQQLARSKGLPLVILRLFHVYGPMESAHRLVPTAIRSFLTNQPMTLTERGYHHDFVYVGDVVKACLSAAAKDNLSGQIFNIASGSPVSNERVIALISAITNKRTQVTTGAFAPREWDKTDWFADISKAREQLGWQPETNLQDGLQRCVTWFLENEQ